MKEATGEVSMTVITIVLLVAVLGIGMWLFGSKDSPGRQWIEKTFNQIGDTSGITSGQGTSGAGTNGAGTSGAGTNGADISGQ